MSIRFSKVFGWLNLSALVVVISAGVLSVSGQQIISENQASSETAGSSSLKSGKIAKSEAQTTRSDYNWTGFYIGGHAGYGWGDGDTSFNPLPSATTFVNLQPTTLKVRPKGAIGGIQGGYNWQSGHLVIGAEGDFSWSNMKKTTTVTPIVQNNGTPFPGAGFITASQKTKWMGTLRPRVGAAYGRVLVYGTAGLAYGRVQNTANTDFRPTGTTQYPASISKTKAGWTAGGGVEIGINNHVSIKSEYLYYDLGKNSAVVSATPALPPFQVGYQWNAKGSTWKTGINFRF